MDANDLKKDEQPSDSSSLPKKAIEKEESGVNAYAKYSGLGFQMLATIGGGVILGQYLDKRQALETLWWTIGLTLLGIGMALYFVFKTLPKN